MLGFVPDAGVKEAVHIHYLVSHAYTTGDWLQLSNTSLAYVVNDIKYKRYLQSRTDYHEDSFLL